jgi:hypothetical protein
LIEIWKDIENYEGYYQISNFGKVRSLDRHVNNKIKNKFSFLKGIILKTTLDKDGYQKIGLRKCGKRNYFRICRLVAQAFIPNPDNKPQTNHINGIKNDDNIDNLEWVNQSENQIHAFKLGLQIAKKGDDNP